MLTFQAGQNFSLSQQTPGIQQVDLDLSWEPTGGSWTLDASAFALTNQGRVRNDGDFIFYNQPTLMDGGIQLEQEGRRFAVRFADLPPDIARIAIAVTLDAENGQTCAVLHHMQLQLRDSNHRTAIASFTLDTTGMMETAIIMGELYRRGSEWKFRALGQGFAGGLAALAVYFGVDISDDAETLPAPPASPPAAPEPLPPPTPVLPAPLLEPVRAETAPLAPTPVLEPPPMAGPVPSADALSARCRELEQVGNGFLTWIDEHPDRVGQEKAGLTKEFRRFTAQARRLNQAVQRPMCAGVFGPSQSGKSYLISALARKGNAPLLADFVGQKIDFIRARSTGSGAGRSVDRPRSGRHRYWPGPVAESRSSAAAAPEAVAQSGTTAA